MADLNSQARDLESIDSPSTEDMNILDAALDASGVHDIPVPDAPGASAEDTIVVPDSEKVEKPDAAAPDTTTPPVADPNAPEKPEEKVETETPAVTDPQKPIDPPPGTADARKKELEELDLDSAPPASISQKGQVNWRNLQASAKLHKTTAETLRVERDQIKKQLEEIQARGVPENFQKELDDHRAFRRLFDTERSPEFKQQFDDKISALDEDIFRILRNYGLDEKGEAEFRREGLGKIDYKWFETNVLANISGVDAERIRKKYVERADLTDNRAKHIETIAADRDEYLRKSDEDRSKQYSEYNERMDAQAQKMVKDFDATWAIPKEIPANATASERKAIEEHNQEAEFLSGIFEQAKFPATPEARVEIAAAATASVVLSKQVASLTEHIKTVKAEYEAKVTALNKELTEIKSQGIMPASDATEIRGSKIDTSKMSDEEAMEANFAAAGL